MKVLQHVQLCGFLGDYRFHQGVFYTTPEGYENFVECATTGELMQAVRRYPVHTIRIMTIDERVIEVELSSGETYIGAYEDETYDDDEWLTDEDEGNESEGSND